MNPPTNLQEIKVSYSRSVSTDIVNDSSKAFEICKKAYQLSEACISLKEYFFVLFLNRANKVKGFYLLSTGGISGTVADIRLAFGIALRTVSCGIIICHNHPSGTLQPSEADIRLTKKFKEAGELLDITVLDHLIISEDAYTSFADEGLL